MSWQAVCTIAAIGFLCTLLLQLLPIDGVRKWSLRHYLVRRAVRWCKEVAARVDLHCLQLYQRHATLPLVVTANDSAVAKNSLGTTRVKGFFGREVSVGIEEWNLCMCRRRASALAAAARRNAARTVGALETRFLFSMQRDGLLLDLSLVSPTAKRVLAMKASQSVAVFELVVRYPLASPSAVFLYAESASLGGRATAVQKTHLLRVLRALNASSGQCADVPLRSLRCKSFVDAGVGREASGRAPRRGAFFRHFRRSFA